MLLSISVLITSAKFLEIPSKAEVRRGDMTFGKKKQFIDRIPSERLFFITEISPMAVF